MSEHPLAELVPLAALGALDGDDRRAFETHAPDCAGCRTDLARHEAVATRIGLAADTVPPAPGLRTRVLQGVAASAAPAPKRSGHRPWLSYAALAAALVMAVGSLLAARSREQARRETQDARKAARELEARVGTAEGNLRALRAAAAEDRTLRDLLAHPQTRVAALAGLGPMPLAHGRMIWKPETREAVLLTLGLAPAPEGKTYAVWVIGPGAPVPAGVFQVDTEGKALVRLPRVDETSQARTFAVTLEPAGGGPAPTGPMVLAGAVS